MHFQRKRITPDVEENSVALTAGLAGATPATTKQISRFSLSLGRAQHIMQAIKHKERCVSAPGESVFSFIHTKFILTKSINRDTDISIAP
jgi:hypothetical protein